MLQPSALAVIQQALSLADIVSSHSSGQMEHLDGHAACHVNAFHTKLHKSFTSKIVTEGVWSVLHVWSIDAG